MRKKKNKNKELNGVKIIPIGGLGLIGMNMTAFEYDDSIIVVDCGMAFPDDNMLGIDCVIPDISYLVDNADKVKGFVITHAHEDHIGALPYVLKEINVPVYATKLTMGIIDYKLEEHGILKKVKRKIIKHGQSINLGCFRVEFIKTTHSIQDSAAFAIHTPVGVIVHTGDFKVDLTPVFGDPIDLQRFAELGKKGVLALLADSTNAGKPGYTMSESTVGKTFDSIFSENTKNRIIVATFASNVDRVQQIINSAKKFKRKIVIEGRSMVNVVNCAQSLGYIKIPDRMLIDISELKNYPPEKVVIITTGSQGEAMAALSRMASAVHKKVQIVPGDVVILSSNPIPGNEKSVSRVINELSVLGAKVFFQDTHVSGHASKEEIKLMYALTKPKFAIPVHGEYRHLLCHKEIAISMGLPKDNVFLLKCGDVLEMNAETAKVVDTVPAGGVFVDGLGVGDVGNAVLKDRQILSENGLVAVVVTIGTESHRVIAGPEIITRGFVYVKENGDLIEDAIDAANSVLRTVAKKKIKDKNKIRGMLRDEISDFVWKRTKRNPMIVPVIMDGED